jgi:hypothetical protein
MTMRTMLGRTALTLVALALFVLHCSFNAYHPTDTGTPGGLDADGHTREGERLLRDGDWEAAADEFSNAIELDSNSGYARLGYAKATFDRWGLSQTRILKLFARDSVSQGAAPFQTIAEFFNDRTLELLDSLYAPAHVAVDIDNGILNPLFDISFVASDDFQPAWIAADFSLLLAFHAFISLLDLDDNGRIDSNDIPFGALSLTITEDTVIVEGLDALLSDAEYRSRW